MRDDFEVRWQATRVHGRYLVHAPRGKGRGLIVGFHGYGEDAAAHLAELRAVEAVDDWVRVAVQALHPFYLKTGDVVASWMTSLDRERAIDDNLRYVRDALTAVQEEVGLARPLVYSGFSQGTAMAYRAAASAGHVCDAVVAVGGDVPPEVELGGLPPVLIGRGSEDEWYSEAKLASDVERLEAAGVTVETCVFEAGHVWTPEFHRCAGEFIRRLALS